MNTFHTDYVYRVMEHRRSRAMATRLTPAGVFWAGYAFFIFVVVMFAVAVASIRGAA